MRRTVIVLAMAVSMASLAFAAAGSAARTQSGDTYSTGSDGQAVTDTNPISGSVGVVFTGGGGVANAAAIPGGDITTVCAGTINGTTFTLTANCGEVTSPLTVPPGITTPPTSDPLSSTAEF